MREFLNSGRLGDIMIGITADRVKEILAPPEDRSVERTPFDVWRDGAAELTFRHGGNPPGSNLVSIALYFSDAARFLPAPIQPADWLPPHNATEQSFESFLSQIGISPQSDEKRGDDHYFALPSGVQVVFSGGKLHSMHFSRPIAEKRKQISVALPLETVEALKQRARQQNTSVQKVIEMLVVDKISAATRDASAE